MNMKTQAWKIENCGRMARSIMGCGSLLPLSAGAEHPAVAQSARTTAHSKTCRIFGALPLIFCFLLSAFCFQASGQTYSVDWYKIAGGGGVSTGGTYQVSGTIGQPDASVAISGGQYSVTGGFWSIVSVVQTAGVPNLLIVPNGPDSVKILWDATGSYALLQSANLASAIWTTNTSPVTTLNGTNSITVTPPAGNLFFRLKQ